MGSRCLAFICYEKYMNVLPMHHIGELIFDLFCFGCFSRSADSTLILLQVSFTAFSTRFVPICKDYWISISFSDHLLHHPFYQIRSRLFYNDDNQIYRTFSWQTFDKAIRNLFHVSTRPPLAPWFTLSQNASSILFLYISDIFFTERRCALFFLISMAEERWLHILNNINLNTN